MESNELRISNETKETVKDLKRSKANQERRPRNQQRRLKHSCELTNSMQDRQWRSSRIQEDLESIRKFSILNCIRERVYDVLSELPLFSIECLCQLDIDGVIRRNLLKERKVRFSGDNEYEGEEKLQRSEEELEKESILDEMDIVLKVLGNDKRNKLVIENFELLEKRIAQVEQRLSGLIRRLPKGKVSKDLIQSQIVKIDVGHVRMDIQNFVNKFNKIFTTSHYEVPGAGAGATEYATQFPRQSVSSTNRLKFQMLSRLPDTSSSNDDATENNENKDNDKEKEQTLLNAGNNEEKSDTSVEKTGLKADEHALKAVDSLITLRERFKMQSGKWGVMNGEATKNEINEAKEENEELKVKELFLSKERRPSQTEATQTEGAIIETATAPIVKVENTETSENLGNPEKSPQIEQTEIVAENMATISTIGTMSPILEETAKRLHDITNLVSQHKSVQTSTKKKKKRSKSGKRQKGGVQPTGDPKEVWVQYVNQKVLRSSKSTIDMNEHTLNEQLQLHLQKQLQPQQLQSQPQQKLEKLSKKSSKQSKQQESSSSTVNTKEIIEFIPKTEVKKNEQVTTQFKEYKKIFLLKLPKGNSKQSSSNSSNNSKANHISITKKIEAAIKESNQKKLPENKSKNSLIRLIPKAFKPKTKEQKQQAKEEKQQKTLNKNATKQQQQQPIIPNDEDLKIDDEVERPATKELLNKIRNRWIYAEDQNSGELVQKPFNDAEISNIITLSQHHQNIITRNRKPPQKPKKK